VRAILFDEKHVFPVSTLLEGEYGISGVCISVPAVIGRKGIVELIPVKLSNEELQKLQQSAQTVKGVIDAIQKTL
jgi:L-lactate dehydrogenase